jgi:pyruvate/2-oxoglutarate dehydrogenase complex dihydrolipoamide dehydrogenase (E3) component
MNYDFVVIGGGSAGYAAARTAADLGLKTAVVDGGREVGGLCILRGCMPSKTLIESANRFLTLKHASEFGLSAEGIAAHPKAIVERKRRIIGEFAEYRREQLESGKFDFIRGFARFTDPYTLEVALREGAGTKLQFSSALIATGSEIQVPSVPGLADCGFLTSDDILDMEELPPSMIVLGAGPVALELAHYLSALGVKVTIIQRGVQLLTGMDRDVADALADAMLRHGITIYRDTQILGLSCEPDGTRTARFRWQGKEVSVQASAILNALGRKPSLERVGLDVAGVDRVGLRVDTKLTQQTSREHIFAAGDCSGPLEVVHVAIQQGEVAARNAARILGGQPSSELEAMDYRLPIFAVFTEPQVAATGLTEEEALAAGFPVVAATYPFNDHGKSIVMGELDGFVKLIANRETGELLGGSVVGPHASDLIHEVTMALAMRATAAQFAAVPHYHPTLSEIWTYPAEELAEACRVASAEIL